MTIRILPLDKGDFDDDPNEVTIERIYKERSDAKLGKKQYVKKTFAINVDGEGDTLPGTNEHRYVLLTAADADGKFLRREKDPNGISTEKCFWFLLNLPVTAIKVGFSVNYDINMMLRDMKPRYLTMLHEKGYVHWKGWTVCWTPHKSFSVSRLIDGVKKTAMLWDIFSYFQMSFVRACELWHIGDDERRKWVAEMKELRGQFYGTDPELIKEYCDQECYWGAEIFQKVLECTREIGLRLSRYDGAGSVAHAMLKKHSIKDYMHQGINRLPDEVILSGYNGGRFDITAFGLRGDAIEYDINSAYPYQALHLPCLSCSPWVYSADYDGNSPWAIWDVSWELDKSALWSPFPYRNNKGVYYLRNGRGWYWADEVREAIRLYPDSIRVHRGYRLNLQCDHQPFSFVQEYYDLRERLKKEGNLAELIIKLGLNSLYGKLAQNIAHGDSIPQTQCYIWAGIITSNTRAMLLASLRDDPASALLLATDAVIRTSTNDDLELATGLGNWKPQPLPNLFIVGNGIYEARGKRADGSRVVVKEKTRGFSPAFMHPKGGANHWDKLRERARESERFDYKDMLRTDFNSLGSSIKDNFAHFDKWRTWETRPHVIGYGKFKDKEYRDGRLYPAINPYGDIPSSMYKAEKYRYDSDVPVVTSV